jgi:DNA-binding transcriptional LysR family regulator
MGQLPSLDHLAMFRSVVTHGSFSAAAQRAGLSQPAVSLQIRELERRLGVRLIERIGRRATPTAAGVELLGHAGRIDTAVSEMRDAMARYGSGEVGRIRLGTGATACTYLLPPILGMLRARFPTVEITVTTGNTPDIVKAVEENGIDVGFVTLPAAGRTLEITPLMRDEFVVIAPRGCKLPARITPAVLADLPLLLFEPGGNTRRIVDDWFGTSGGALKPVMSLGSVEAIKGLVGAGLGCAVVPRMALKAAAGTLDMRALSPRLHRDLATVIRCDRPQHRALKALVQALKRGGEAR